MKKTVIVIVLALVSAVLVFSGFELEQDYDANLYSNTGYIDYAEKVFLDVQKYPDMAEMGLFWTRWDEDEKRIVQVPADSAEGAALVDPDKPTIINVHGLLLDGYYSQEAFRLNSKIADPNEFDIDADIVSLNYLWLREGWNVANYHYNRFASEINPGNVESKIWSTDSPLGVRYRHQDGTYSAIDITQYCLAEHFAAEYIRAMRLLPDSMGEQEIRFTAHSMGGMLTTAALFLLTELAEHGQLPKTQLPVRYALLDSYFSTAIKRGDEVIGMGPKDITISWSGKPTINNSTGDTMMACLNAISKRGIALEYYTYETLNFLLVGASIYAEQLRKISAFAVVNPDFQGGGYSLISNGHNGVREWYLCSLLDEPIRDITDADTAALAPSAALPTALLSSMYNKEFQIVDGTTTVRADDDTMMQRFKISYNLGGGKNSSKNPNKYIPLGENIPLSPAKKAGATFMGWYENKDFSGEKITEINRQAKKNYVLYAKWQ